MIDDVDNPIRAFLTEWADFKSVVYTTSVEHARFVTLVGATDAGYEVSMTEIKVTRLPKYDNYVTMMNETPGECQCWAKDFLKERE